MTDFPDYDTGPETVAKLAKAGSIPSLLVGRSLRFDLGEVLKATRRPEGRAR